MSRATDLEMRDVLVQLELVSHGTITNYNPSGGGGESEQALPAGRSGAEHEKWRGLYERADTDEARQRIIAMARAELRQLRGHGEKPQIAGESARDRDRRIVDEGEGFSVREVAIRFRCGERDVRKARLAADPRREPELGHPVEEPDRARIVELFNGGERTIASLAIQFGLSRSTVERYVGKRKNGRAA